MLSCILIKYINLFLIFATVSFATNEVKNETSSKEVIGADKINETFELMENCLSANLRVTAYSDSTFDKKTVVVIFALSDSSFKNCFTYFDIFLKKDKKDVNSAKVPFNYDMDMKVSYTFQNVSCGFYEVVIQPCYNNWQCAPFIVKYPKLISMTSNDCSEKHSEPLGWKIQEIQRQDLEKKILLITTVVVFALLLIIGISYMLANRKLNKEKTLCIEGEIGNTHNYKTTAKRVQVFIINHYNDATIKKVELLKDFMLHCQNLDVILIEDGLAVSLITGSEWLNSMLKADENDKVIKKLIIVDSIEEMEAEENEIENSTFYEAIKKLSCDWSRSIDDYGNLFVVHFNSSFTKLKELDYIVKRVRYCIPDDLITLCLNVMSGSYNDMCGIEENLRNLLFKHDIRNLSTYNV